MRKLCLFLLPLILLTSCTSKLKCDLEDGLEGTISYAIEKVGQCTGTAAVRASVNSWVDSANACPDENLKQAVAGGIICGAVLAALDQALSGPATDAINSKFPGWNCNPQMLISGLTLLASTACNAVFPGATNTATLKP